MTKLEQKQAELIEWYQRNSVTIDTEQSKDLKSEIAKLKKQAKELSEKTEEFLDKRLPYQQNKNLHYMEVYEEVLTEGLRDELIKFLNFLRMNY